MADINDPRNAPASKINEALAALSNEMTAMHRDVQAIGAEVAGVRGIVPASAATVRPAAGRGGQTAAEAEEALGAAARKTRVETQAGLDIELKKLAAIKAQTEELNRQAFIAQRPGGLRNPAATARAAEQVAAVAGGAAGVRAAPEMATMAAVQTVISARNNAAAAAQRFAIDQGRVRGRQLLGEHQALTTVVGDYKDILFEEERRAAAAQRSARALDLQQGRQDALWAKTRDRSVMGEAEARQARLDMLNPLASGSYRPTRGFDQFPVGGGGKAYPGLPVSYVNQGPAFEARRNTAEWEGEMIGRNAPQRASMFATELTRLGTVQAAASQQMRRHGALTTEFLTALARGETTLAEFGWQIQATAGKFAGWTAAAAGVYGVVKALGHLKDGAIATASGVNVVQRVVTDGFEGADAQDAFISLSKQFNVPIETAVDAVYRMGQRFHSLPEAVEAAKASLYSFKTGEVDVATSTENLLAIVNGFHLGAQDLAGVYDQINQAQNTFGIRIGDTEAGLAKAAGTYRNAGGDLNYLLAVMTAIGRATNRSGQEIGTGIARGVNEIRKPINQAKLEAQGVDVDPQNFQKTLQSGLEAAKRSGADLQQIASGLFGNQYARLIAPVLADQTTLNKAIGDTSPEKSKGSAQRELAKVLGEVNEQITQTANSLERIGGLLAQSDAFDIFGGMLKSLNQVLGLTEHLLDLFNDIPEPFRQVLVPLAEITVAMNLLRRTRFSEGLAESTGLSFLGPRPGERERREAIIGTRSAEQTAANAFESSINAATMSKVEAQAQNALAVELAAQAKKTTNIVEQTGLNERAAAAEARSAELLGISAAQEELAIQYQNAYTQAIETRVALQKRQITAEAALVGTAAAFPGGVNPAAVGTKLTTAEEAAPFAPGGAYVDPKQRAIDEELAKARAPGHIRSFGPEDTREGYRARMTASELAWFSGGPVRPPGPIQGSLDEWAHKNTYGDRLPGTTLPGEDWEKWNKPVVVPLEKAAEETEKNASKAARAAARLRSVGGELGGATKRLGTGIGNFIAGMGPIGLAFTGFIIGDEIRRSIEGATEAIEKQNKSLDEVPHSVADLRERARAAADAQKHGAQDKFGTRAADFISGFHYLDIVPGGDVLGKGLRGAFGTEESQADVQDRADKARQNADEALVHARQNTRGSGIQNVGLANKEIVAIADRESKNAKAWGHSRAEVNAAFDRYVRDVGVSIEGITTGKTDQAVVAKLNRIRAEAMEAFGPTKKDPFAQFRAGLTEAVDYMGSIGTRASTYGTSSKDLDTLLTGALFTTAAYGQSTDKDTVAKVAEAQQKVDAYVKQMIDDLTSANRLVEDRGAEAPLTAAQVTPAALRAGMSYVTAGRDRNYEQTLGVLRTARDHVYKNMDRVMKGLEREQHLVAEGERLQDAPLSERIKANVGPDHVPVDSRQLAKWLAEHRAALKKEREKVKGASEAAARRAQQIQAEIDSIEQQRYEQVTTDINTRVAFSQSTASDKSSEISVRLRGDAELVKAALNYHGPNRWAKIMQALTQQNNDIAAQSQQHLADIQGQTDLRVSRITAAGPAADRARLNEQLSGARRVLSAARTEAANPSKADDIRNAEIGVNNILHQINEQAITDAKDAHDLARQLYDSKMAIRLAGVTDPLKEDRLTLERDRHDLTFIQRGDFKTQAEYQIARNNQLASIKGDRSKLRQDEISSDYEDAQFQHNIGKLTDDAYLSQLRKIVHMKGISKQMRRQLLQEIYQQTHDEAQGGLDLNVGNIRMPSIYEVRRAMKGGPQTLTHRNTSITNSPTFHLHVHSREDVGAVGQVIEDATGGAVRANLRAAGLI